MDRLVLHEKSADLEPGKGAHELTCKPYKELAALAHWRRVLCQMDEAPFEWTGCTIQTNLGTFTIKWPSYTLWRTVTHALQAAKIGIATGYSKDSPAWRFSLSSRSDIGQLSGVECLKHKKVVMLSDEQMMSWMTIYRSVLESIMRAKLMQDSHAARVLIATGSAELYQLHKGRNKPTFLDRMDFLERIRDQMSS